MPSDVDHPRRSLWLARPASTPLNIAHRGASKVAPENTLAAFESALELGADGVELDVRLSADRVPVVIHDATVDGTTDGTGRVDVMDLVQLKRLDAGSAFNPDFAGERIPTLAEVLETVGEKLLLNIELKSVGLFDHSLERAVVDLIQRYALEGRVLLSSFSPLSLRRIQQMAPCISTGLLYAYPARFSVRLASPIMPRAHSALHPGRSVVDEQHIRWAHARNARVHVWTVDDPTDMRRLIAWGVDGIITNTPDLLRKVLENLG